MQAHTFSEWCQECGCIHLDEVKLLMFPFIDSQLYQMSKEDDILQNVSNETYPTEADESLPELTSENISEKLMEYSSWKIDET